MTDHIQHMKRCLELARMGKGRVAPNPMVGCVITKDNEIIAEGWHKQYGGPHAEADAIGQVTDKSLLKEATLYVNLEPCAHHGKTPPCAELITRMEIPYVVVAMQDPYHEVAGKGIAHLVRCGVDVKVGVLEQEARFLNRRFLTCVSRQRPYVILKWAQSADGFIDHVRSAENDHPAAISSDESLTLSHQWRADEAAILVGTNTVLTDNPQLTVRRAKGQNPVRVTFDRRDRIPGTAKILDGTAPTIVFNSEKNYTTEWAEYVRISFDENTIHRTLYELWHRQLQSVIVEGGAAILKEFLAAGLWDEARVFYSPKELRSGVKAPDFAETPRKEFESGSDVVRIYYNR